MDVNYCFQHLASQYFNIEINGSILNQAHISDKMKALEDIDVKIINIVCQLLSQTFSTVSLYSVKENKCRIYWIFYPVFAIQCNG